MSPGDLTTSNVNFSTIESTVVGHAHIEAAATMPQTLTSIDQLLIDVISGTPHAELFHRLIM